MKLKNICINYLKGSKISQASMRGLAKIVALTFAGGLLLGCPIKSGKKYTDPYNPQSYSAMKDLYSEVFIGAEDQTQIWRDFDKPKKKDEFRIMPSCMPGEHYVVKINKIEKDTVIMYRVNTNPKKSVRHLRIYIDDTQINKGDDPYSDWKFIKERLGNSPGAFCDHVPKKFLPKLTKGKHFLKAEIEYDDGTKVSDLVKIIVD